MRPDLQVVATLVQPGSRVLDLGCGTGELLAYLAKSHGCTGTGVDTDPESLIAAIRHGVSVIDLNGFGQGTGDINN
ncbi:MAG TPA: methionine biosynthesis protein MetW, partial [Marmoricola sp.]|nr:methionine biosynthesis protein MetW [Marmoricola sp.]